MLNGKIDFNVFVFIIYYFLFCILVKQYDPSILLKKVEQSLENVVNNVMQAGKRMKKLENMTCLE